MPEPIICEHCGHDDATVVLALCSDCLESLPDAEQ